MEVAPYPDEADKWHEPRFFFARERLLPAAKNGDRAATLRILHFLSGAIADHCPIPSDFVEWFAPGLFRISCGDTVETAFAIPGRKRGEGKEGAVRAERGRRHMMAWEVERLRTEQNEKREVARRMVADTYGVSIETVSAAYKAHRQQVKEEFAVRRAVARAIKHPADLDEILIDLEKERSQIYGMR